MMILDIPGRKSGSRRPSGTGLVEAVFALVVFLAFVFLIVDTAWGLFAKATLQQAVRSGVRYAVTSQTMTVGGTPLGQIASIKNIVQTQSMGFLSNSDLSAYVTVTFFSVSSNPPTQVTGVGSNSAGNLVIVSVNGWPLTPITALYHSNATIPLTVSSADLIESNGTGTAPPTL